MHGKSNKVPSYTINNIESMFRLWESKLNPKASLFKKSNKPFVKHAFKIYKVVIHKGYQVDLYISSDKNDFLIAYIQRDFGAPASYFVDIWVRNN